MKKTPEKKETEKAVSPGQLLYENNRYNTTLWKDLTPAARELFERRATKKN